MTILCTSAVFFKKRKVSPLLSIEKMYKPKSRDVLFSAFCNFCLFIFSFWHEIRSFSFYNGIVNRKEMNFHEKQIPQLYWKCTQLLCNLLHKGILPFLSTILYITIAMPQSLFISWIVLFLLFLIWYTFLRIFHFFCQQLNVIISQTKFK